jgi:hypothetical protein
MSRQKKQPVVVEEVKLSDSDKAFIRNNVSFNTEELAEHLGKPVLVISDYLMEAKITLKGYTKLKPYENGSNAPIHNTGSVIMTAGASE